MINSGSYKKYEGSSLLDAIPAQSYPALDKNEFQNRTGQSFSSKMPLEEIPAYFPSKDLVDAVEYARLLKRPLLLRGEPGSGKTRLAQAVAFELYGADYRKKYFEWYIKSTTKVNEGLYHFDHLSRLRDVQLTLEKTIYDYRSFGPLGKSFLTSEPGKPSVLLIDEIDKADLDFPNDLLLELDQKKFFIQETEEEIIAAEAPIIIITSNDEKDLPNAFLRRCVFHYIDFPDETQLLRIITAQAKRQKEEYHKALPHELLVSIVNRFSILFQEMRRNPNTYKQPSTSELLDWIRVIHYYYLSDEKLIKENISAKKLLFPEVLLKSLDDFKAQTNIV